MELYSYLKEFLSKSEKDMRGRVAMRKVCLGDVREDVIWFEICDSDKGDFRKQYAVPKRHYKYSQSQLDTLESLSDDDRSVYKVKLECENKKGTKWLFKSMEKVDELPQGYEKNSFYGR